MWTHALAKLLQTLDAASHLALVVVALNRLGFDEFAELDPGSQ